MKKIAILGAGESGVGAAILGKVKGMEVLVSDSGKISESRKQELRESGIEYEEGGHSEERICGSDLVVKSPGIPEDAPLVVELRSKGIPVISEIEFAGYYSKAKMIGITGANGKTTTTLLTHHLLTSAGVSASLAGNIGKSLARQVANGDESEWYVIELSSFQLDGMEKFRCDVGVLCNITPDHMDRYDHDFSKYARSKMRITQNMRAEDTFVYNIDDEGTMAHLVETPARKVAVSTKGKSQEAHSEDGRVEVRVRGEYRSEVEELPIKGIHNVYNSMMAIAVAQVVGLSEKQIKEGLKTFKNAPHRLEHVRTLDGVEYVNDSKATNVDAAWYALECQKRPVIWIVGGKDKGNDYGAIYDIAKSKVRSIVCLGKDNKKIIDYFGSRGMEVHDTHSIEECVMKCREVAQSGDVVLLSPCCASFDLFTSYENRGDLFRKVVESL
ncbi:MAG: UDP-N-acetylmuramoyl-L-alanine--D-glutamate ligase [Bacteroidales bacterium]|nr:UDP-N-acetylmuramoyl-L-alanine--D-glutamate ligase [Bacteroidales bacterium]